MNWRVLAVVAVGVLVLALLNWTILQKEHLIAQGRVVLLQLAPVDPRSLMQGDYMALNFALVREIQNAQDAEIRQDGFAILKLDENNIAHFARFDNGTPLQSGEVRFHYRTREDFGGIKIATNAFFFEEGQADTYATARYGEFRVADNGDAILTQMRDEKFKVLGRSAVLN
jgi:uncharacterized membrane-anchored protein